MTPDERYREFFNRYARVSLGSEPERLADFYDRGFIVGGPGGSGVFNNDESFVAWLREVRAYNEKVGMTSLHPGDISETPIGAGYTLVAVEWASTFQQTGDSPIRFTISYLLREAGDELQIAGYISHEDQEEAMREHGLI